MNLLGCQRFSELRDLAQIPPQSLSVEAIKSHWIENGPLALSYAGYGLSDHQLCLLQALFDEQNCLQKFQNMCQGEQVNPTEKRAALHSKTREVSPGFYHDQTLRFCQFAAENRDQFTTLIQVGIGGSELGPHAIYQALSTRFKSQNIPYIPVRWITSVDTDRLNAALEGVDLKSALFLNVSKSGNTAETTENITKINALLRQSGIEESKLKQHWVTITMPGSPSDIPEHNRDIFYIDEAIGGRFSTTSAVGGVVLSLAFGPEVFLNILKGAHQMDKAARQPEVTKNMAALYALLTIWDRNIKGRSSKVVVPYSFALSGFIRFIQQVSCESLGKKVSLSGEGIEYQTGMPIWGDTGSEAQHSFFQLLHQGTEDIPAHFIATRSEGMSAYLRAQMVGLSIGTHALEVSQTCPGNRPHSLMWVPEVTPESLGALIAFYENATVFESFLWDINAFDQEGVQLGKALMQPHSTVYRQAEGLLLAYLKRLA